MAGTLRLTNGVGRPGAITLRLTNAIDRPGAITLRLTNAIDRRAAVTSRPTQRDRQTRGRNVGAEPTRSTDALP